MRACAGVSSRYGKEYTDTSSLRYGRLLVMADQVGVNGQYQGQDYDGSHIKGLVLNLFETFWPSLLRLGYVSQFITPIVKVTRKGEEQEFYTMRDFEQWMASHPDHARWRVKCAREA